MSIIGSIVDDEEAVLEEEVEEQRQDHYALLVRAWEAKVSPCLSMLNDYPLDRY